MPLGEESLRVAIAGATPLRGKDLKTWIEQSGFPAGEVRLFDEEPAVGTLTDVGGEPAFVQRIEPSSFDKTRFAFFTGSPAFAAKHATSAQSAGATVIDLSGGSNGSPAARPWIPSLDALLPPPPVSPAASGTGNPVSLYLSPSTPAIVACSLAAAFAPMGLARLVITFFQPVSERGQAGVEELESQTAKLLSFQPLPQEVFDTQVAFNMVDRWGAASPERFSDARAALTRDVQSYLAGRLPMPAMTIVQAPVFYGHAFTAYVEFAQPIEPNSLASNLEAAGCKVAGKPSGNLASSAGADDQAPSNLAVAGEEKPWIGQPERDPSTDRGYWLWGAADNLRVASANALRIAERLLAS